uniref:MHC class I antigen n=1 Tax=Gasterosteus aculeatus TaxID=69293 RepID=A3FFX9_GASAC|nr:MHC class I antigen [Gasterosteus aculeatus]
MRLVGAEISVLSLLMMSLHGAAALTHSMKYFFTGSSGVPNFPEFVAVGRLDEVEVVHYDGNTRRAEPRQDWMIKVIDDDPQYWKSRTELAMDTQQAFKGYIEIAKQSFNQTGGVHIYQRMAGCEWDNETNEVKGYIQDGYNGEDFISFDLQTDRWIAAKQQAVRIQQMLDHNRAFKAQNKNFLTHVCPEGLKKFLSYGRSSLMRTERPSVSLLQKTPSSPVSCHATGFYPDRADLFWRKDGEELHEDVDLGEILPNHDGTFQMRVDLKLSSVPAKDWRRYDCVFQLSGVDEDIVTKLDKTRTNTGRSETRSGEGEKPAASTFIIIIIAVAVLVIIAAVVGFKVHRKRNDDYLCSTPPPTVQESLTVRSCAIKAAHFLIDCTTAPVEALVSWISPLLAEEDHRSRARAR